MAIYDYQCSMCGFTHEVEHSMKESLPEHQNFCFSCNNKGTLSRVFTMPAVTYKEGNGAESSKPDPYWNNAERERIKNMEKKQKREYEKKMDERRNENK